MIEIIKELKAVLKEKRISPETAALLIGINSREVRRWMNEEFIPNFSSRKKLRLGLRRIRRIL